MIFTTKNKFSWHPWFAWKMVYVSPITLAWLQIVERKKVWGGTWEYRLPNQSHGRPLD